MRSEPRRRVLLSGCLVHGDPPQSVECAIADLSRSGARVRIEGPEPLASPLFLIDLTHGLAFEASVVWRRPTLVGLTFSGYFDLSEPGSTAPKILRALWAEQFRRE